MRRQGDLVLGAALVLAATAALAVGCSGDIVGVGPGSDRPGGHGPTGGSGSPGTGPTGGPNVLPASCPSDTRAGATLDQIGAYFESDVYPLLARADAGGCVSCHGLDSGRAFKVTSSASETFLKAQAGGFLDNRPAGLLARLTGTDPASRMPLGAPAWTTTQTDAVERVVCELAAMGGVGGDSPDEQFPPALLQGYTGPASDVYDNTFLVYPQLKARIKATFNDDWVRDGVDKFADSIALFGGADFKTRFQEVRSASPDFLLGLDALAKDVCGAAAANVTGPFAGIDVKAAIKDLPASTSTTLEAEDATQMVASVGAATKDGWMIWANGTLSAVNPVKFPATATYRITVRALGSVTDGVGPTMPVQVDGAVLKTFENVGTAYKDYVVEAPIEAGSKTVVVAFTNDATGKDGVDRNLTVDKVTIEGPLGGNGSTAQVTAARAAIGQLHERILSRHATEAEIDDAYSLLADLLDVTESQADAWSGVCEGLLRHPDFLFTLAPSRATSTDEADRRAMLLTKVALDLTGALPDATTLADVRSQKKSIETVVDDYLASSAFRDWFFYKMRLRTESDGSTEADEPARLWTYLTMKGEPFQKLLSADFGVDESFAKTTRPDYHGATGLLTMKGYIKHKQGLPHYNYAARVMTDYMGSVFQVPPEVLAQRDLATAASTVDPKSMCFSCHQILTPLTYQRLRWDDDGNYRTTDEKGASIDDSDRGMVEGYPYKGQGIEAFSTRAVKKEVFIRHTINAAEILLLNRPLRADDDERTAYKSLWDVASSSQGDLRRILKAIVLSPAYQGK